MKITSSWINLTKKSPEAWGWLFHYLLGSGKNLSLPKKCIEEAKEVLLSAMYEKQIADGNICVGDSRYYNGVGFMNKPTLFYLVGGFTAQLVQSNDCANYYKIEDVYDWHPNTNGVWAWSATPLPRFFGKILSKFFPDLFSAGDCCMAVSNKLWSLIGKPFTTVGFVRIEKEKIEEIKQSIIANQNYDYDDDYEEDYEEWEGGEDDE